MTKANHKVITGEGDPCPRCKQPTQIREHKFLREKQFRQPFYYSRWFYCTNPACNTEMIMPEKFKISRENQETWDDNRP